MRPRHRLRRRPNTCARKSRSGRGWCARPGRNPSSVLEQAEDQHDAERVVVVHTEVGAAVDLAIALELSAQAEARGEVELQAAAVGDAARVVIRYDALRRLQQRAIGAEF